MDEDRVLSREVVIDILRDVIAAEKISDPVYKVTSGASKGDGYMSFITRVDVEGADKKALHLVIKHAPKNAKMREMMPINKIFSCEIKFYSKVIDAFEKFQKERNVKRPFNSYAKCFKTICDEGKELLVFDNIKEAGFSVHEKSKQMSDAHVRMVLREYGKLHAISFAMRRHAKDALDVLERELQYPFGDEDFKQEFVDLYLNGILKVMSQFDENKDGGIYSALVDLKENFMDFLMKVMMGRSDYEVITHGDCWCNNMMFKYQDGSTEPSEMRLFDFQLSRFASPAIDLIYFFYVTASQEMLDNHTTYMKVYHDSLRAHLAEMGCDADELFPFSALEAEWKKFAKYGLLVAMLIFRVMLRDADEVVDFTDNKDATDTFMADSRNDELINARYKRLALHLYENGFI